ncbi:hypothetical protein EJ075_24415 [Mesorhizobium sp. M6A.T.Cr.TU.016.01.1.1]|nr:hypothetical protein EJ075_24415 [Mesorhizobium sp. M6A.T.Cr.TU.016.01.1.1]
MLGALIMFGLRPGPDMFTTNGDLIWGVIASLYIANFLLLILNMPLAGLFARLLSVRYSWLYPPILAICLLGAYANSNSLQDCWLLVGFGLLGWIMKRYSWPAAPLVLGLVLGPLFETSMRQALSMSRGDMADLPEPADLGDIVGRRLANDSGTTDRLGVQENWSPQCPGSIVLSDKMPASGRNGEGRICLIFRCLAPRRLRPMLAAIPCSD